MIARVTLENFFSFGEPTTIELNPDLNILVGINGSGKSNFLKAIRLLYESIAGSGFEKIFLKEWGGFGAVANFKEKQEDYIRLTFEFDGEAVRNAVDFKGYDFRTNPIYEITIYRAGNTAYYLKEKVHVANLNDDKKPFVFMDMENAKGVISTRGEGKVMFERYREEATFKSTELVLRQISDPDRFYPLFTLKRALEGISVYNYFDTSVSSSVRQPDTYGTEEKLLASGQNLTSLLLRMKNHHSLAYEKIEAYIQKINPNFKDISFDFLGSKFFLVLREKYLSKSISVEHISDGSLRYLLLLSILLNPDKGGLLCIDEPETGLHPDMIGSIAEVMKAASQDNAQLIIATHSPLLLNAFELDKILIFEKGKANQTVVSIKTEDDFDDWNENFLSGQLWMLGLIGAKRW